MEAATRPRLPFSQDLPGYIKVKINDNRQSQFHPFYSCKFSSCNMKFVSFTNSRAEIKLSKEERTALVLTFLSLKQFYHLLLFIVIIMFSSHAHLLLQSVTVCMHPCVKMQTDCFCLEAGVKLVEFCVSLQFVLQKPTFCLREDAGSLS